MVDSLNPTTAMLSVALAGKAAVEPEAARLNSAHPL